jgi:hypothetical protein
MAISRRRFHRRLDVHEQGALVGVQGSPHRGEGVQLKAALDAVLDVFVKRFDIELIRQVDPPVATVHGDDGVACDRLAPPVERTCDGSVSVGAEGMDRDFLHDVRPVLGCQTAGA